MIEAGINLIGPKAIRNIPDLLRYEPKFSLDLIVDVAFPIGEYDSDQALNLGQNRWYGRVGTPIVWQIGPWVPGRRTTLEVLPSVWFFSDNDDYVGQTLSTDPMFQLEAHLTRDFTEHFWGSARHDLGGRRQVERGVGFSRDRRFAQTTWASASPSATRSTTTSPSPPATWRPSTTVTPAISRMDGFRISFTYGWHKIVEGQKRLKFDKFYGFIGGEANQWAPFLHDGVAQIEIPNDPNYHLNTDLANQAVSWVKFQKAMTPTNRSSSITPPAPSMPRTMCRKDWIAKWKGKFDGGWDKMREETLARQIKLGVVPAGTKLAPKPEAIKDWDKLSADEKRLFARQAEVFAAFVEQTDYEIGRVVQALKTLASSTTR
jgi:hypothetical protein